MEMPDDDEPEKLKITEAIDFAAGQADAPSPPSLAEANWQKYAKLLTAAKQEETSTPQLSARERQRFLRNCELISRVNVAIEVRNYVYLEIIETQQWRSDYPTIAAFAKSVGVSKSQLYKCADSARINLQMAEAGMFAVAPRGREIELLAKIDPTHRIAAWCHARRVAQRDGESLSVILLALRDFCREIGIPFGRIRENGSANTGLPVDKSAPIPQMVTVAVESTDVSAQVDWIVDLSDEEKSTFEAVLSPKGWFQSKNPAGCDRGARIANLLLGCAQEHLRPHSDVQKVEMAIALAIRKDASLKRAINNLALHLVAEYINARY